MGKGAGSNYSKGDAITKIAKGLLKVFIYLNIDTSEPEEGSDENQNEEDTEQESNDNEKDSVEGLWFNMYNYPEIEINPRGKGQKNTWYRSKKNRGVIFDNDSLQKLQEQIEDE